MATNAIVEERLKQCKQQCYKVFSEAILIIINKLQLTDISLAIFNRASIEFSTVAPDGKLDLMALRYHRGTFTLMINPISICKIKAEEMAWLILHETLHYVLQHPLLYANYPEQYTLNIGMDLVVNDILTKIFSERMLNSFDNEYFLGPSTLNYDCSDKYIGDIYEQLLALGYKKDIGTDPAIKHGFLQKAGTALQNSITDQGMRTELERMTSMFSSFFDNSNGPIATENSSSKSIGSGIGKTKSTLFKDMKLKFKFDKVFKKLTGQGTLRGGTTSKGVLSWCRSPLSRVAISSIEHGSLPCIRMEDGFKKVIHIYFDVSSSIDDTQLAIFTSLVNNIPRNKFEIRLFTFTTEVSQVPLKEFEKVKQVMTGGGTDFNCIANHAILLPKYPDNILILTDGIAKLDNSRVKGFEGKWTWIIDGSSAQVQRCQETFVGRFFGTAQIYKELTSEAVSRKTIK